MAEKIGAGQPGHEALAVDDAALAIGGREVAMREDAAIDHGHADPGAVPPGLPGDIGANGLSGHVQMAGHSAIGRDISDLWIARQRPDLGRRQKQVDSLDVPEAPYDLVRGKLLEIGSGRYVVELHDDFDVSVAPQLEVTGETRLGHRQTVRHKDSEGCQAHTPVKNRDARGPAYIAPNGMVGGRPVQATRTIATH